MVDFKRLNELTRAARADIEKNHPDYDDAQKRAFELGFRSGANWQRKVGIPLRFKNGDKVVYANRTWIVDVLEGTENDHYVLTDCEPETTSTPVIHVEFERDVLFRAYTALSAKEVIDNYISKV